MRSAIYFQRAREAEAILSAGAPKAMVLRRTGICLATLNRFIDEGVVRIKDGYNPRLHGPLQAPPGKRWFKE